VSIVIVDDSADHRTLIERVLHNAGYFDTVSVDSAGALYAHLGMDRTEQPATPVEVILMDIIMPEINGLDACRTIKADPRFSDISIIMVTSMTDADHLRHAFSFGATDYIRKPIIPVEVIARVCTILTMQSEMAMRKKREQDLELAMRELKALRGCTPICASCKRIRGVNGTWQSLEEYVKGHADVLVDDTICNRCIDQWRHDQPT